jgi:hypothetical protein
VTAEKALVAALRKAVQWVKVVHVQRVYDRLIATSQRHLDALRA